MDELEEKIKEYLTNKSAKILNIEPSNIEWDEDIDEYGFDSMKLNKFCLEINEEFGLKISPALFLEYTSLAEFSKLLKKEHYLKLDNSLM